MKNVKIKVQSESDHKSESGFQVRLTCTSSASTPASTLLWRVDQVGVFCIVGNKWKVLVKSSHHVVLRCAWLVMFWVGWQTKKELNFWFRICWNFELMLLWDSMIAHRVHGGKCLLLIMIINTFINSKFTSWLRELALRRWTLRHLWKTFLAAFHSHPPLYLWWDLLFLQVDFWTRRHWRFWMRQFFTRWWVQKRAC